MNKFAWAVVVAASLSLVMLAGCPGKGEQAKGGGTKVGVVDLDHVLRETRVQESYEANLKLAGELADKSLQGTKKALEQRGAAIQRELAPKLEDWNKQVREDLRTGKTPTSMPEEVRVLQARLNNLQVIMNAAIQAKQQQVQAYANETRTKFRMDIQPMLQEVAKASGVAVIIDKNSTLFAEPDVNLDAALVNKLNEKKPPALKEVPREALEKEVDIKDVLQRIGINE